MFGVDDCVLVVERPESEVFTFASLSLVDDWMPDELKVSAGIGCPPSVDAAIPVAGKDDTVGVSGAHPGGKAPAGDVGGVSGV